MDNRVRYVIAGSILVVMVMYSFSFAMAPLYNAFCKATGFYKGIKIPGIDAPATGLTPDYSREVTVQFVTTNNHNFSWDFYPRTTSIDVHPDQYTRVTFTAKNNTKKTMTVQAIPSYAPARASKYFHKIQCFCFNQQTLNPGESIEMPVVFRVDKKLPRDVRTITLAYTLFDVTPKISQRIAK